jgi:hypothetical protein
MNEVTDTNEVMTQRGTNSELGTQLNIHYVNPAFGETT